MNSNNNSGKSFVSHLFASLAGGVVAVLIVAGFGLLKSEGKNTTVVNQAPVASGSNVVNGKSLTAGDIYEKTAPGVVFITAKIVQQSTDNPFSFDGGQSQESEATGSGFLIDSNGDILTNAHVIDGASKITVTFTDKKSFEAKVVGKDVSNDLALLNVKAEGVDLKPLTLGDSTNVKVGDPTIAIGNPFGLDRTLTTGVVSALQRKITAPNGFTIGDVIQTDAAINPGNSGGPLLDASGRVIGINSQIATNGSATGSVGIGFAVPIDTAKSEIKELKEKGRADHAFLGLSGLTIDEGLKKDLNLPVDKGVLVQSVSVDGPASKAGLEAGTTQAVRDGSAITIGGDIVVKFAGKDVSTMDEIVSAVNSRKPGDKVEVEFIREGKAKTVTVQLTDRPNTPTVE